jgi:hypothetical protein
MAICARPLLVRKASYRLPERGQDLLFFADLTCEMVSLGEEEIADRQFLSIFGCIHQHGACRHQSERPKIVGFGPSTHDCPVSGYQRQRQIDRRRSQEHSSKLLRAAVSDKTMSPDFAVEQLAKLLRPHLSASQKIKIRETAKAAFEAGDDVVSKIRRFLKGAQQQEANLRDKKILEAVITQLTQTVARLVNAGFGVNIFRGVDLG